MKYLLDTNIISEKTKKKPNQNLIEWLDSIPFESTYLSIITIGEIKKGIQVLNDSKRKFNIELWLENEVLNIFNNRILDIDFEVISKWSYIAAKTQIPDALDSLIAATALTHNLILVTRNTKDFSIYPGLEVLDPF